MNKKFKSIFLIFLFLNKFSESVEEIEILSAELSDLYKKKSKNDQQIIDISLRLKEIQENIVEVTNEYIFFYFF